MIKVFKKAQKSFTGVAAAMSAYVLSVSSSQAAAGDSLASVSSNVGSQIYVVSDMISTAAYVAGAAFGMAGVMKLKAHAENPGQTPIMHGAGRIAAGAGLVALPWVINTAFNTTGSTTEGATAGVSGSSFRF